MNALPPKKRKENRQILKVGALLKTNLMRDIRNLTHLMRHTQMQLTLPHHQSQIKACLLTSHPHLLHHHLHWHQQKHYQHFQHYQHYHNLCSQNTRMEKGEKIWQKVLLIKQNKYVFLTAGEVLTEIEALSNLRLINQIPNTYTVIENVR